MLRELRLAGNRQCMTTAPFTSDYVTMVTQNNGCNNQTNPKRTTASKFVSTFDNNTMLFPLLTSCDLSAPTTPSSARMSFIDHQNWFYLFESSGSFSKLPSNPGLLSNHPQSKICIFTCPLTSLTIMFCHGCNNQINPNHINPLKLVSIVDNNQIVFSSLIPSVSNAPTTPSPAGCSFIGHQAWFDVLESSRSAILGSESHTPCSCTFAPRVQAPSPHHQSNSSMFQALQQLHPLPDALRAQAGPPQMMI